jgi:hypothetical protein
MTPVRPKRGKWIHVTHDARVTLCGKRCDGWNVGTDAKEVTCPQCHETMTTN